ncbi:MAG: inositol monophosphatase family protein [Terriglobales bacterium]
MSSSEDYLPVVAGVAREAGALLLNHFGRVRIEYKGGVDIVTAADRESEALIVDRLRARYPRHDIVAEEGGGNESGAACRWLVDPLDGTTNFAHGLPWFAVSIALEREGKLQAGVVYHPCLDELFAAQAGQGASLNGRRIQVSPVAELRESLVATGFPTHKRHRNPNIHFYHAVTLRSHGVRRMGAAALDLCYTACGRFEAFWEFNLKPWDTAAGSLIVREAGGRVSDMMGADHRLASPEILASNGRVHAELQALFQDIFAGQNPSLPSAAEYRRERAEEPRPVG